MKTRKSTAKAVLMNLHALRIRSSVGDMDAVDALADFDRAVALARLTKRQKEALHLVYERDLSQTDAARIMNVSQPAVADFLKKATDRIDDVYEYWAWHDGELSAADFAE